MGEAVRALIRQAPPITVRPATVHDIPFIINSWLGCYKDSPYRPRISRREYNACQQKTCELLIARAECLVACNPEDPSQIFGYVSFERATDVFVLHFIYVKGAFRRLGIARALLGDATYPRVIATHNTPMWQSASPRLFPGHDIVVNPYLVFMTWPQTLSGERNHAYESPRHAE